MANNETGFVIVKREFSYGRIPELVKVVTGFPQSEEWAQLEQNGLEEFPGIVLGALGRYLLRLSKEPLVDQRLVSGFDFIEKLAASDDSELHNAVVYELFEPMVPGTEPTRRFYAQLGARASELYREYCND